MWWLLLVRLVFSTMRTGFLTTSSRTECGWNLRLGDNGPVVILRWKLSDRDHH